MKHKGFWKKNKIQIKEKLNNFSTGKIKIEYEHHKHIKAYDE